VACDRGAGASPCAAPAHSPADAALGEPPEATRLILTIKEKAVLPELIADVAIANAALQLVHGAVAGGHLLGQHAVEAREQGRLVPEALAASKS
jgi:hypothetical protein